MLDNIDLLFKIRLITSFAAKDGEALYSLKTNLGANCVSDPELLIGKFRLELKKVGKITRPFGNNKSNSL